MGKADKQSDFAKAFLEEAGKQGGAKTLGSVVGMPDDKDWENLINIINLFRKESVSRYGIDIVADCIATARQDFAAHGHTYNRSYDGGQLVSKDSAMRYDFELPEGLIQSIEVAYPTMFRDKQHYQWFKKKFRALTIHGI